MGLPTWTFSPRDSASSCLQGAALRCPTCTPNSTDLTAFQNHSLLFLLARAPSPVFSPQPETWGSGSTAAPLHYPPLPSISSQSLGPACCISSTSQQLSQPPNWQFGCLSSALIFSSGNHLLAAVSSLLVFRTNTTWNFLKLISDDI